MSPQQGVTRIPGRLGILSEEDKKQVFDALHLVNAADIADRDFDKISDGQRQRVLLARAVCQEPGNSIFGRTDFISRR